MVMDTSCCSGQSRPGGLDLSLFLPIPAMQRLQGSAMQWLLCPAPAALPLQEFSLPLSQGRPPELLQLFGGLLLARLPGGPLTLTDICSGELVAEVPAAEFGSPRELTCCSLARCFLAFHDDRMEVWDFTGQRVGVLHGCALPRESGNNLLHLSRHETHVCLYSEAWVAGEGPGEGAGEEGDRMQGQLRSNAAPGGSSGGGQRHKAQRCCSLGIVGLQPCQWVVRLGAGGSSGTTLQSHAAEQEGEGEQCREQAARHAAALEGLTSLFYDEPQAQIFAGTADGRVHVWSC